MLDAAEHRDYNTLEAMFFTGAAWMKDRSGNTALHKACLGGSKRMVKLCLRNNMDINLYNALGKTPLHCTVLSTNNGPDVVGRAWLTNYMIDHGAWIEAPDFSGATPLLEAARVGHGDAVRMLVSRQADAEHRDNHGTTALQLAVAYDRLQAVQAIVSQSSMEPCGMVDINVGDEDGATPLHDCASNNLYNMTNILLNYGADMDAQDNDGYTPLVYAISAGHCQITTLLMESSCDITLCDSSGRTPLHVAAVEGRCDMLQVVALHHDCDMNRVDDDGDTPLHTAAINNNIDAFKMLLQFGANPNVQNSDGDQPAHIAAAYGLVDLMKLLIEYEADMNCKNWAGFAPIGEAQVAGRKDVVELLLLNYVRESGEHKVPFRAQSVKAALQTITDTTTTTTTTTTTEAEAETTTTITTLPTRTAEEWAEAVQQSELITTIGACNFVAAADCSALNTLYTRISSRSRSSCSAATS